MFTSPLIVNLPFAKEESEWVSLNKTESLVLKLNEFNQITYLSLDKYIQNKNKFKVSENLTKVMNYVHYLNKAITIGEAFSNFQDCKNHTWDEIITSNNTQMIQFSCDILSEKKFVGDNIIKFKQNNIKISPILLMGAMAEDIKEVNFDAQYMKIDHCIVESRNMVKSSIHNIVEFLPIVAT